MHRQSYGFSSSQVWMWELDHKEGWVLKNWCFQIVVLEKTLESPLDWKELKPVNPKGNQPWLFTGRTDAEASILWPPDVKSWHIGKDPDAGKDWGQKERRAVEEEMVRQHNCLSGYKYEQTPGNSGGAWHATVHEVTKSWTRLSDWTTATTTLDKSGKIFLF